jgi:hypothetical protein
VETETEPLFQPAGMVMVGGTVAAGSLAERVAVNPPAGAGFDIPTIAVLGFPPVQFPGTCRRSIVSRAAAGPGP